MKNKNLNKKRIYNFFIFNLDDKFIPNPNINVPKNRYSITRDKIIDDIEGYFNRGHINYINVKNNDSNNYSIIFNTQFSSIPFRVLSLNSFYYGKYDVVNNQIKISKYKAKISKKETIILEYALDEFSKDIVIEYVSSLDTKDYYLSNDEFNKVFKLNEEEWYKIWNINNFDYFLKKIEKNQAGMFMYYNRELWFRKIKIMWNNGLCKKEY